MLISPVHVDIFFIMYSTGVNVFILLLCKRGTIIIRIEWYTPDKEFSVKNSKKMDRMFGIN